jgi:beta-mannanase
MDGFWVPYGLDPANFKLAYWRIQTIFAEEGVPANSVYWVFAPTGYNHHSYPPFEDYYPGHETVDVVGFSSYNFGYCPVDEYPDWLTPDEQLGEFIRRMEVMAPGKAVFITQFAASSYVSPGNNDDSVKSQWLEDAYTYLAIYESVKAALYFNLDNGCDWAFYNTWDGNSRQLVGYRDGISIPAYEYVTPSELSFSGFFKTTP